MIALRTAAVAAVLVLTPAGPALADDPPGTGRDRPATAPAPTEPRAPGVAVTDAEPPGGGDVKPLGGDGAVAPGGDGAVANAPSVAGHGPGTRHTVTGLALAGVAAVAVAVRSAHRGRRPDATPGTGAD
ncbi:hypothetical protein M4914_07795 [Streptomyces somaliensis DSM 40738]|uniref:Uncharacterized protein n=1 Tax=Streptomyces somaliensis (strain ATCC 33201 / DSM 40738 / JCM 12659 / KCTC 9044 / NCTC 11332 / NRRL B-12077 / IP 733) TaxID=1134445 RepID=A0AA44DD80_STRE0|nr:hypothetical protein [Streptomyces somaliensis]MCQ0022863.1 hypothetical protein [Streptomyces somaliensis DSM 40738]NKY14036.1 hypothetical protein [Streptomyces somaliensis DSM 40738]